MEDELDKQDVYNSGLLRLGSGEYPEAVARDLRKHGIPEPELHQLFASAAACQRRRGAIRIIGGVFVSLVTALIVVSAQEAGIEIYGPGLAIGLVILANGLLKLRNSGEIAKVIKTP